MPRVAFATYQQSPQLSDDDRLVADVLRKRGVDVHPVAWDAPDVDWPSFDLVAIRSTWDYHLKPGLYEQWLRSFLPTADRLWNPPTVVLGNLNKRYLGELAKSGVNVVPTAHVAGREELRLRTVIERSGWDEVVIKPAISASGRGAWRSSLAAAGRDQARFAHEGQARDMLVQPYFPEIASSGEWSLVFFDGTYSHAVVKKPADGDFRVQRHFGGRPEAATPAARLVDQASAILDKIGARLLYARVDGIERDGDFVLMELEVNEPYLFLSLSDDAPTRFADAIVRVLSEAGRRGGVSHGGH
jgi:glutathione synthase/RimK-type ligase-like ATP-grasp enzyme